MDVRTEFKQFHTGQSLRSEKFLDTLLGIHTHKVERQLKIENLVHQYGNEDFSYQGAGYAVARNLFRAVPMKAGYSFYDLGAGFGRFIIYGALTGPGKYTGIEIVEERVKLGQSVIQSIGLNHAQLVHGNVLDHSFDDGDVFFVFNSFFEKTLKEVCKRLKAAANEKPICIASLSTSNDIFRKQKWLEQVKMPDEEQSMEYGLTVFKSLV